MPIGSFTCTCMHLQIFGVADLYSCCGTAGCISLFPSREHQQCIHRGASRLSPPWKGAGNISRASHLRFATERDREKTLSTIALCILNEHPLETMATPWGAYRAWKIFLGYSDAPGVMLPCKSWFVHCEEIVQCYNRKIAILIHWHHPFWASQFASCKSLIPYCPMIFFHFGTCCGYPRITNWCLLSVF